MSLQKRFGYMVVGGLLAMALVFGAYVTFAQEDEGATETTPETEAPTLPEFGPRGQRGGFDRSNAPNVDGDALLAEALGITVEELQAAKDEVRVAAIEQAVIDGRLTQEEADQLLSGEFGGRGRRGFGIRGGQGEGNALLAEALGISEETLEVAQAEVHAARLEAMVEAGIITQEQADTMQAYKDVQGYVDRDALSETVQSYYEAAVAEALADGVITQEQADTMLENIANLGARGFGGFGERGGHGSRSGHGPRGGGFGPGQQTPFGGATETAGA